jgi:hypothetical protein
MATALEELKEFERVSIKAKQEEIKRLFVELRAEHAHPGPESWELVLDLLTHVRLMYELTVVEARAADDIDQIAELWKDTFGFYHEMRRSFREVISKDSIFRYCGELIDKLESAAHDQYQFHAK